MKMKPELRIRELINRLARLDAAQAWSGDLNPTQSAVLDFLGRANRFSRSPSHVADYLGTTRGTVSQSLKSLTQKGYVIELRSKTDKRAISFDLTAKGQATILTPNITADAVATMDRKSSLMMITGLEALLMQLLARNGGRSFGVCNECTHFVPKSNGGHCSLLSQDLAHTETSQICHEQQTA